MTQPNLETLLDEARSGQDVFSILNKLKDIEWPKSSYRQRPYSYVRTSINHNEKIIRVCIETNGFNAKGFSSDIHKALAQALEDAIRLCNEILKS